MPLAGKLTLADRVLLVLYGIFGLSFTTASLILMLRFEARPRPLPLPLPLPLA